MVFTLVGKEFSLKNFSCKQRTTGSYTWQEPRLLDALKNVKQI